MKIFFPTVLAFFLILMVMFSFPEDLSSEYIRQPAVSGTFYPEDARVLSEMVQGLLTQTNTITIDANGIVGLIVPHAGYLYSGKSAGKAYGLLKGMSYDTVVIIGPSHHYPLKRAAIMLEGAFETPLGKVEVDSETARQIYGSAPSLFINRAKLFAKEHSIEVQLPFLQVVLKKFSFVPIEVNILDRRYLRQVARAIYGVVKNKRALVVVSTDLSHYHSRKAAGSLDKRFRGHITAFESEKLLDDLTFRRCEACGGAGAALALMVWKMYPGATVIPVDYSDSGDVTGDATSVVGYLSAIVISKDAKSKKFKRRRRGMEDSGGGTPYLSMEEKRDLIRLAKMTVQEYVRRGKMPDEKKFGGLLAKPGAAFVTIEKEGHLRGCIGYTEARLPLYRTVMECAVSAATEDPRFSPLQPSELDKIKLEISVLTPLKKIENIKEIEVGRHGLMVSRGYRRGLLLPQVATEYGWDRDTFLSQTCLKAGLASDDWKEGVDIYTFEAQVFGEDVLEGR